MKEFDEKFVPLRPIFILTALVSRIFQSQGYLLNPL